MHQVSTVLDASVTRFGAALRSWFDANWSAIFAEWEHPGSLTDRLGSGL